MLRKHITTMLSLCALTSVGGTTAVVWMHNAAASADATLPELLPPELCARKIALDLTGRGPTDNELARLASGAATLGTLADEYLESPEFEDVVYGWYAAKFPPTDSTPEGVDTEEPVRIAQYLVTTGGDYREIVTAKYTVSAGGEPIPITDRPAAGVLSTQHYMSAYSGSFRRNWAGHFLGEWGGVRLEAVSLPPDLQDADLSPANLLENPACAGCHGDEVWGVDHLAGFAQCYNPDGTYRGGECSGSWLTESGAGLEDLGRITAGSKRFQAQTVNFFFERLFGRPHAAQEADFYIRVAQVLTDTNYNAKLLIRHIVTSEEYCSR